LHSSEYTPSPDDGGPQGHVQPEIGAKVLFYYIKNKKYFIKSTISQNLWPCPDGGRGSAPVGTPVDNFLCKILEKNGWKWKGFAIFALSVKENQVQPEKKTMFKFQGKVTGKVDDKGRIVLPAAFRDIFARAGETDMTMVVKRSVQGNCLDLFPYQEWARQSDKVLEGLDIELNSSHAAFWRKYNDGVHYVVPDGKLSRLNIPSELLGEVGITREVVFAGVGNKIEIWDKARREATLMSDEEFQETAARLAAKR
jgi:MraZ protein